MENQGNTQPIVEKKTKWGQILAYIALFGIIIYLISQLWQAENKKNALTQKLEKQIQEQSDKINALNTTWDLLLIKPYLQGGRGVDGWEIQNLRTAVQLQGTLNDPSTIDDGWSVEIHIPWHALWEISTGEVPPKSGDQWKINFSRVQWKLDIVNGMYVKPEGQKEDNWVWSPQGVIDMHRPERWGIVHFTS